MNSLIAKLETDAVARVRAGKILSSLMGIVSVSAVLVVAYLSWAI
ncbi:MULTISPECIES: hypothetical protein [unclassified Janthinobacterium]|nr:MULTISPECIES: hypothetical protein [unclassified Janthinobacterium]MBB5610644.1 hypothetical protein [Janthinobacterium sp. S3T4]MBB5616130.1 hypothetical protein [Janthinobacterium sp. S3M3]